MHQENVAFLKGLDPEYFAYQGATYRSLLSEPKDQHVRNPHDRFASLSLRIQAGMATESMFAFLCALIQAPHCVFGWLSEYKNSELAELVDRISNKKPVKTLKPFRPATWRSVAEHILLPLASEAPERYQDLVSQFADTWKMLARIQCDPDYAREYNCLKHSFRTAPVASRLEFKHGDETFFSADLPLAHHFPYLKKNPGRKFDFSISRAAMALEPDACVATLEFTALTIQIVVACALALNGDSSRTINIPATNDIFDAVASRRSEIQSFSNGGSAVPDTYLTADEVLAIYQDEGEA
jgi:hypothetical protein